MPTLTILRPRKFKLSNVAGGATLEMLIADYIDVSAYRSADLIIRIHGYTISSTASATVSLGMMSYTPDDPAKQWSGKVLATSSAMNSTSLGSDDTFVVSKVDGLGSLMFILLQGTQPGTPVSFDLTLSMDLVLNY